MPRSTFLVLSSSAVCGLVDIKGGTAVIGLPEARADEILEFAPGFPIGREVPERRQSVMEFRLARFPTTHREYLEFVEADGYRDGAWWREDEELLNLFGERAEIFTDQSDLAGPSSWSQGAPPADAFEHPVHGVSWFEARAYCRFRKVRLPNELEWEWAARGPEGHVYPWGNLDFEERVALGTSTQPVGTHKGGATPAGIFDLAGNVAEWTNDRFEPDNFANTDLRFAVTDTLAMR